MFTWFLHREGLWCSRTGLSRKRWCRAQPTSRWRAWSSCPCSCSSVARSKHWCDNFKMSWNQHSFSWKWNITKVKRHLWKYLKNPTCWKNNELNNDKLPDNWSRLPWWTWYVLQLGPRNKTLQPKYSTKPKTSKNRKISNKLFFFRK